MELKRNGESNTFQAARTFNCTLWNWNAIKCSRTEHFFELLIVPYGIET